MDHIPLHKIISRYSLDLVSDDRSAWLKYPYYNKVYNKLWLAESQGLDCGPVGIYPNNYPIIMKPIINLYGMSRGVKIINNDEEYDANIKDGFFWEEYLDGIQYCLDIVLKDGDIAFYSCMVSVKGDNGTFKYHYTLSYYDIPQTIKIWIRAHLTHYTGCVNMEIINNIIIECHLRLNGDTQPYSIDFFLDLDLFLKGDIQFLEYNVPKTYIFPIFVPKDFNTDNMNESTIHALCRIFKANSIYFQDIGSLCQSEYMSRYVVFDIDTFSSGIELQEKIIEYIER